MMRTITLTVVFLLHLASSVKAQYFDAGIFFGVGNYQGELVKSRMEPTEYNFACGGFLRYNLSPHLSAKAMINGGTLTGTDAYSGNRSRNLNFRTFIAEAGVQLEYNLLSFNILDGAHTTSPYFFGGLTAFYFNPRAEYRGSLVELRPLGTEGQGLPGYQDKYSNYSVAVPVGVGLKVAIHDVSTVGFEVGFRKTFTDYLDDVSGYYPNFADLAENGQTLTQALSYRTPEYNLRAPAAPSGVLRGNPNTMDWYMFAGVTLSINLKGGNKTFGKHPVKRKTRGPRFYSKNPWYGF